jgi:hypothetical protein
MRAIHILIISLGLGLIVFSWREIQQVRQYRVLVGQVQSTASSILISASMDSVLSELDSANKLEKSWWVAGGIGCSVCVLGFAGLVLSLRRQKAANKSLQAAAAPPCC